MKSARYFYLKLGYLLVIVGFTLNSLNSLAAPITFNSALPVSQSEWVVRGLVTIDERSANVDDIEIERTQLSLVSVLGYGINAKWSAFGVLPIRDVSLSLNDQTQNESDLGDAEFFSRYEVLRVDKAGSTFRVAPFAGVRLPTGDLGVTSDGTTDIFGGVIVTSANVKQNFNIQLRYDLNGNDNQFSAGDSLTADLSWQKRIFPKKVTASTSGFWFAALESNLNYTEQNRLAGQLDSNSGGFTTSIAPGIQYITRRWIAELAVRVPIIRNLNGSALEPDYTIFTGVRANF